MPNGGKVEREKRKTAVGPQKQNRLVAIVSCRLSFARVKWSWRSCECTSFRCPPSALQGPPLQPLFSPAPHGPLWTPFNPPFGGSCLINWSRKNSLVPGTWKEDCLQQIDKDRIYEGTGKNGRRICTKCTLEGLCF